MPATCVAANCSNTRTGDILIHKFPTDPVQFSNWTKFVSTKRAKWSPSSRSVICSDHFTDDSYDGFLDLKKEFGIAPQRRRLLKNALPTIHKQLRQKTGPLPVYPARCDSYPYRKRKRTAYFEKRERKRIVKELLGEVQETIPVVRHDSNYPESVLEEEPEIRSQVDEHCEVTSEETLREV